MWLRLNLKLDPGSSHGLPVAAMQEVTGSSRRDAAVRPDPWDRCGGACFSASRRPWLWAGLASVAGCESCGFGMCCEHPWGFRVGGKPGHVLKSKPEVFCERSGSIDPACREPALIKTGTG